MLLEATKFHKPEIVLRTFDYRAQNPLVVNNAVTIYGAWEEKGSVRVWASDDNKVVGMTGSISYE